MTTADFLDILEDRQLVSDRIISQLRQKVAQGDHRITAKSILKYLVKKELVTKTQAKQLLETTLTVSPHAESSILGLVPMPKAKNKPPVEKPAAKPKPAPEPAAPAESDEPAADSPADSPADSTALGVPDLGSPFDLAAGAGLSEAETDYDPLAGDGEAAADAGSRGKKKKKRKKRDRRKQNEWDSPLLMIGFGALALLIVSGVLIYYLLFRENADKLLQEAADAFNGGSYSQAVTLYEKFVENHPRHPEISEARVRLGMAKLRRDTEGKSDYTRALETALQVTDDIQDEPAFSAGGDDGSGLSQAKREMSELLTTIAVGLANQAEASDDGGTAQEFIDKAKTALGLCSNTKLVPQRFRLSTELDEARETLERVERRLTRDADLAEAIATMDAAMAAGDTAAAFAAHKALLKQYPRLVDNKQLAAKIREVSAAEQALVKFTPAEQAAETNELASPIVATVALAERSGPTAPDAEGEVAVTIDGNLYGLSASDGSLLWRRRTGRDQAASPPVSTGDLVVAADVDHRQVIAVKAADGELLWRQPVGEPLGPLAVHKGRVFAAGASGKLYVIDADSGQLQGHVQFGQAIRVAPALSARGDRMYLVGEHSNLYTLSGDDLSCLGVYYLGHAKGSVAAPPLVVLNKVIVAEKTGVETSQLHVLGVDNRGIVNREVTRKRLRGLVLSPMMGAGRRFAALTSLGGVSVMEAGSGDDETALTELADRDANANRQTVAYGVMVEGPRETNLWVADDKLQKLAVLPTGGRLPVRSLPNDYEGDAFDHELIRSGGLLVHVRRPNGGAGALVAAIDLQSNEPYWETALAVPPAGAPAVDDAGMRISAAAASGAAYLLDRQTLAQRVQNEAERASSGPLNQPLTDLVDLGDGRFVASAVGAADMLHFRPAAPRGPASLITPPAPLAAPPVAWANGFLAATQIGQVFTYAADDGAQLAAPFQPTLQPGEEVAWLTPAAVPGDDPMFAVSDGVAKIYLVRLSGSGGDAQLELAGQGDVGASSLETRLAAAGGVVMAGNKNGQIAIYSLPEMQPAAPVSLGGRITWGPYAAGDAVLAGLDAGELIRIDPSGEIAWRRPLPAELAEGVLVEDDAVWVLEPAGALVQIDLGDGSERARIELGEPAVAGPKPFGPRLIVAAPDGALLVVDRPN